MNAVRAVRDADFADLVLGASVPVLVGFHAAWCAPWRVLRPVLDELADEMPWMSFVSLDVVAHPITPAAYQVDGLPTMLVFTAGEPVLTIVGARPKRAVHDLLVGLAGTQPA